MPSTPKESQFNVNITFACRRYSVGYWKRRKTVRSHPGRYLEQGKNASFLILTNSSVTLPAPTKSSNTCIPATLARFAEGITPFLKEPTAFPGRCGVRCYGDAPGRPRCASRNIEYAQNWVPGSVTPYCSVRYLRSGKAHGTRHTPLGCPVICAPFESHCEALGTARLAQSV
jgi:hypothetical protein